MEWYAAFGILVSIVWIYIETIRLLSKLQAFRNEAHVQVHSID